MTDRQTLRIPNNVALTPVKIQRAYEVLGRPTRSKTEARNRLIANTELRMFDGNRRLDPSPLELAVLRTTYPPPESIKTLGAAMDAMAYAKTIQRSILARGLDVKNNVKKKWWYDMKARFTLAMQLHYTHPYQYYSGRIKDFLGPLSGAQRYVLHMMRDTTDNAAVQRVADTTYTIGRSINNDDYHLPNVRRPRVDRMYSDDITGPAFNKYVAAKRRDDLRHNLEQVRKIRNRLLMGNVNGEFIHPDIVSLQNGIRAWYAQRPPWTPTWV